MKIKVVKFGGSSLATGAGFIRVRNIIKSDEARKFVVVSAPGKRYKQDTKVTDLLLAARSDYGAFQKTADRFQEIISELKGMGVNEAEAAEKDLADALSGIKGDLCDSPCDEYMASRGEYLSAIIMASLLDRTFIDAKSLIKFSSEGKYNEKETMKKVSLSLDRGSSAVVPGFYGSDNAGNIRTFSRGGSDITGSIIAAMLKVDLYENWTDVSGVYAKDPNIYKDTRKYSYMSYADMRRAAENGAAVLHPEALDPVEKAGVPIRIKNSFRPQDEGTLISCGICGEIV